MLDTIRLFLGNAPGGAQGFICSAGVRGQTQINMCSTLQTELSLSPPRANINSHVSYLNQKLRLKQAVVDKVIFITQIRRS